MVNGKTRRALGRGLSNLIPLDLEEKGNDENVLYVDVNSINVNPFQLRKDFNEEDIKGLADSIKAQGLLQPIVLRKKAGRYEIISGERRFRALKSLGKDKIQCILKAKVSDDKMLEMALVENIQREDLNDIEIALSYKKLLFDCGLSHQELSGRVGKSRSVITNTLRLLKLPEEIQKLVRSAKISMGHGRAILSINSPRDQYALAKRIVLQDLTVREVESLARAKTDKKDKKAPQKVKSKTVSDPDILYQEERLRYHFGTDVKIVMKAGCKGKIEISYYNKKDLERVLNIILT